MFDGMPMVLIVNAGLNDLADREKYSWRLSIILEVEHLAEHGMPAPDEREDN